MRYRFEFFMTKTKTFLGSNYLETLSMKILDLSEKGVIQSLRSSWWSGSNECEATSSVTANDMEAAASLDLSHLGRVFRFSAFLTLVVLCPKSNKYFLRNQ